MIVSNCTIIVASDFVNVDITVQLGVVGCRRA